MKKKEKNVVQKDEKVDYAVTLNKGMKIIQFYGLSMTKMELLKVAKLEGFISDRKDKGEVDFFLNKEKEENYILDTVKDDFLRLEGKEIILLDEERFYKWLFNRDDIVPVGYVPVSYFAWDKGINKAYVYELIRKNLIETQIFGGGRGMYFINSKQVQKILEKKGILETNLQKRARLSYESRNKGLEEYFKALEAII